MPANDAAPPRLATKPNRHGTWDILYRDNGHSRCVSTGQSDRKKAAAVLAGFLIERNKIADEAVSLTVAELVDFYMENYATGNVTDIERLQHANKPLLAFFGAMFMGEIDDETVSDYTRRRATGKLGRKVQDGTIRRELQHLRAVLRFAVKNRRRTHTRADDLPDIEMPAKSDGRQVVLNAVELDRLMAAAAPAEGERLSRAYRFVAIARYTAGRRGAIQALTWEQVDLEHGLIDFREPGRRKTNKRRVAVPIDDALLPILRRAHAEREADKEGVLCPWVLDCDGAIKRTFNTTAALAGLPQATPHVLRHSWATAAARRGVPMWTIAGVLGDTLETVEKTYAHHCPDHLRTAFLPGANSATPSAAEGPNGLQSATDKPDNAGQCSVKAA
jgi:integrase